MIDPQTLGIAETPDPWWTALNSGKCPSLHCSGRLLFRGMETREAECPEWINEENVRNGHTRYTKPIVVTTYDYRCLDCGMTLNSTKFFENALTN